MNNFILNKEYLRKLLINLAVYSTFLDILIFFGTILSFILKLDFSMILFPINIGITTVVSIIVLIWFYLYVPDLILNIRSFIKRNFGFRITKVRNFKNGKFRETIRFKIRLYKFNFDF